LRLILLIARQAWVRLLDEASLQMKVVVRFRAMSVEFSAFAPN
jgi:hypothetical protein